MKNLLVLLLMAASFSTHAGEVDTLEIFSPSMQKIVKTVVITPFSYSPTSGPYPVIYLLHGWSGNYSSWISDAPQLVDWVDKNNALLVCPDGGYDSWWLDSPVDSTVCYETFLTKELVSYIDYYYQTRREPSGRAITGLSMGGHGALHAAFRHSDIYGACGSVCGGVDLRPWRKNNWDLKGILGEPHQFWENWEAASVVPMVKSLRPEALKIIIDCGINDFFIEMNRSLNQELIKYGIPHEYTERPGQHDHEYWSNAIDFQLLFFGKFFQEKK